VTNAPTNLHSWHGYGLAVDVVHRTKFWKPAEGMSWFGAVAEVFKQHDCKWGGDWTHVDPPHFQWHLCKPSPSSEARHLIQTEGLEAVWRKVKAI
jgi:peptidoglycan L-alanyl-D-glutamate endopeptidase CwlK